jgi:methylene-tetrahydromethanopterin dehydrogenase
MDKPYILHMLTSEKNLSPFDVNMAYDAGWNAVTPYTNIHANDIQSLVQDAIFSRGPTGVKRTGIFLGGRDMQESLEMLTLCKDSMVPPFEVSVFADPSGAFTTAAGMVAKAEQALKNVDNSTLQGKTVIVLGGTGPVGSTAAMIAAKEDAKVIIMGRHKEKCQATVELCKTLINDSANNISAEKNDNLDSIIGKVHVVFATAAAGIQLLTQSQMKKATKLIVAADVNAVPPSGIFGLDVMSDMAPMKETLSKAVGIGALAIGNVKYQTQHTLLKQMKETEKPVYYHYEDAFKVAQAYVHKKS